MTNREKMMAAIRAKHQPPEVKPEAVAPEPPKPEKKPKGKHAPGPQVTHKCGHKVAVKYLENMPCGACRNAARQAKAASRKAKQDEVRRTKSQDDSSSGRLPDGAMFDVTYDASSMTWSGSLRIGRSGAVFLSSASGVFRLLRNLDEMYRAAVAEASSSSSGANHAGGPAA